MKAVTIHLDESVLKIIEERRGSKQRTVYIRELINSHILKGESEEFSGESEKFSGDSHGTLMELSALKKDLQNCETRRADLQAHIRSLENQLGFLQLEYQKMTDRLMLPAPSRPWWKFWQK